MSSGGDIWDAPNQQVVRGDQSAPWDEGSGGSAVASDEATGYKTKAELVDEATALGIDTTGMTRADLLDAIEAQRTS